ncbi:MAG: hypothetical protein KDD22_02090 [Bdellovibrionales bacterium]|nr:hypothetical protein [Bdellovibrionales bacterium]
MSTLTDFAQLMTDNIYSSIPRLRPHEEDLSNAKIIAHRGVHDNKDLIENTLPALQKAKDEGLYGIEFDIRWTADDVPVLCHDTTLRRLFPEASTPINDGTFKELKKQCPNLTSLEEALEALARKIHMFIEIKEPLTSMKRKEILHNYFDRMAPIEDFHVMSLKPEFFEECDFLPPGALLPIAELNIGRLSQMALERGWAGLTGHYLLLSQKLFDRHNEVSQKCGTGFINSKNLFYREVQRGMDWLFTDKPLLLKSLA